MRNSILFSKLCIVSYIFFALTSCNNDDSETNISAAYYKITISLNDVDGRYDNISIAVAGENKEGFQTYPMWRLNDQDLANIQTVSLDKEDFTGNTKTYVLTTVNPIQIFSSEIQITNFGVALKGNLKIEKNGIVIVNQMINLIGDNSSFKKNFFFLF